MSDAPEHIEITLSERMADTFVSLTVDQIGSAARAVAVKDLIDRAGLCIAARRETYVRQIVEGWDSDGSCTAIGHSRGLDAAGAAVANGVGTHGEDFDDTLEGVPIRVGAMVLIFYGGYDGRSYR